MVKTDYYFFRILQLSEKGILLKWERWHWPHTNARGCTKERLVYSVKLRDITGLLLTMSALIALAFGLLAMEFIINRMKVNKKQNIYKRNSCFKTI